MEGGLAGSTTPTSLTRTVAELQVKRVRGLEWNLRRGNSGAAWEHDSQDLETRWKAFWAIGLKSGKTEVKSALLANQVKRATSPSGVRSGSCRRVVGSLFAVPEERHRTLDCGRHWARLYKPLARTKVPYEREHGGSAWTGCLSGHLSSASMSGRMKLNWRAKAQDLLLSAAARTERP